MRATKLFFAMFLTVAPLAVNIQAKDHDRDDNSRTANRYSEKDLKRAGKERDKAWRQYLKSQHRSYRSWDRADDRDRDDFYRYRHDHGYPPLFYEQHPDLRR
jgi:hypothetical protein